MDTSVLMKAGFVEFARRLSKADACLLRWSADILHELEERLPRRPAEAGNRIRTAMADIDDAVVEVRDEHALAAHALVLDPNDTHVAAAGLAMRAQVLSDVEVWGDSSVVIVTANCRDFHAEALLRRGVDLMTPDEFGCSIFQRNPRAALTSVDPMRAGDLLKRMRADQMIECADLIETTLRELGFAW